MKYLVIPKDSPPFFTDWYDEESNHEDGMTVIHGGKYTIDGKEWKVIEEDSP